MGRTVLERFSELNDTKVRFQGDQTFLSTGIRIAEDRKNELTKHLAKHEENRQRFEAVSAKMEELNGHI